jgi:signal transduction histidine kinase
MVVANSFSANDYPEILAEYVHTRSEEVLYRASLLSQTLVESALGPEDIIALHCESLDAITAELSSREHVHAISDANQFLLEVMIGYGVHFKHYLDLKLRESLREADARIAHEEERVQEMERIGREREEILAVIAHELRTPITVVRANLELVEMSFARGHVEPIPNLVEGARAAIERLSRLSADLVEASRGGPPELSFAPVDLMHIVDQACSWVAAPAASQGIVISRKLMSAPFWVSGNADALLSVFGNLLSNAIRYTPTGGKVWVEAGVESQEAWVTVRDNGMGIAPEEQTRIFEKFYRASEARRVEARGLGLGLALVKQLVEVHQGRVEVQSAPGEGSTFRIVLPILEGSPGEQGQKAIP